MDYTIHYTTGDITGKPFCFECGEIVAYTHVDNVSFGKSQYWKDDGQKTRVHLSNTGENIFTCSRCGKTFGPNTHVYVISEEFS